MGVELFLGGISKPINPSKASTMTHEEKEVKHNISKLQDQVQQIFSRKE